MRGVSILSCVLTLLPVIFKSIFSMCTSICLCRDRGNSSTVCQFDRHVEENIRAELLFDSPVEYIQILRLQFISDASDGKQKFPFKHFFELGFHLLRELSIVSNIHIRINDKSFKMDYLKVLTKLSSFTFQVAMEIAPGDLSLQLNLQYLNVSFSTYLNFDALCKIVKVSGSALEEVYAEGINYDTSWESSTTTLDDTFFSCFNHTRLRVLHIPKSNIKQISSPNLNLFVPSLEVLDVSRNDAFLDKQTFFGVLKLAKLRQLIISDGRFLKNRQNQNCEDDKHSQSRNDNPLCYYFRNMSIPLLHSLEVVNVGGSNDCQKSNTFYCEHHSQCIFSTNTVLRELYLNHICFVRMDMHISGLHRLEKLDFSSNQCEFISSLAFSEMSSLTTLLLNGNSLSKMEETSPEELRILFRQNRNLRFLNLSANGFARLPSDIFATNRKLEHLDLSGNFLQNLDWLSISLAQLRSLNIKGNRLTTIDSRTRHVIDNFVHEYNYSFGDVGKMQINVANNPISCDCDQEDMLRWLSNARRYISDIDGIVCAETGSFLSSYIDDIDSYSHSCNFQRYKGLLALCTIPFIGSICAVLYFRYYRRMLIISRIRKRLHEFDEDKIDVQRKFLLYLAYSFSDNDIVLKKMLPELEKRLQKVLGVRDNLVCISDRDFAVGAIISDEIIRAVTSSSAVLFIISKEFARSRWCEFEAEIALYQGKPIILVTLRNVKVRSLPASLRKVCFKWTRLEWPGTDNQENLEDFWKKLVKAIIKCTGDIMD